MRRREVVAELVLLAAAGSAGCATGTEPSTHGDETLYLEVRALEGVADGTEPIRHDHRSIREVEPIQRALDGAARETSPDGRTTVREPVPDRDREAVESGIRAIPSQANDAVRYEDQLFRLLLAVTTAG